MAKTKSITSNELAGTRVIGGKRGTKRIGKIRSFVFHPKEKRVIGFIVKRPDLLWMFKRKNMFVSIDGYDLIDGRVVVRDEKAATDNAAYRAFGVKSEECLLWIGLPLMTEDGTNFGVVENVTFNEVTGTISSVEASTGMTANALLGKREIPADLISGFRKGKGVALSYSETPQVGEEELEPVLGCILVSDEVKELQTEGGIAEKAGAATAVAIDKGKKAVAPVTEKAGEVAKKTGEAVNKGAYATGKQINKSKTMFSDFKEEFDKASQPVKTKTSAQKSSKEAGASNVKTETKKSTAKKSTSQKKSTQSDDVVSKGAYTVGKQLKKTQGMFSSFKDEFNKARDDN